MTYRNITHTEKACIKADAYVQFFNFLVRLLFKCGFYLRAAYMQSPESSKSEKRSGTCKMKVKLDIAIAPNLFQRSTNSWHAKSSGISSYTDNTRPLFPSCGFYSSAAYVQLKFRESAASIRVRLLIKCGFYTRLYGKREFFGNTYQGKSRQKWRRQAQGSTALK